jgi:hypothetical protein
MKTKSACVRYSGALVVALLAFSFNLGTTNAVRADKLVELTPATETMVLNVGLSAAAVVGMFFVLYMLFPSARVVLQMPALTVHRDEPSRTHERQ